MKLKRSEAIQIFNGLTLLEKGTDGSRPFNLSWEVWDRIFRMTLQLQSVSEAYLKARRQRFMTKANGEAVINDQKMAMEFQNEEDAIMDEVISIRMPKVLLDEEDLNLKENRIPPTTLVMLKPIVKYREKPEIYDDDKDEY